LFFIARLDDLVYVRVKLAENLPMKKYLLPIFILLVLTSCSTNRFQLRKNFHSRVSVETDRTDFEKAESLNPISQAPDSSKTVTNLEQKVKPKEGILTLIMDKMVDHFMPKKKELFKPVLHPAKKKLTKANSTKDERTAGLIINILAITFAVAALLMIIGVAHGSVWVYFTIGMVLAAAAIILGFIGKHMAWKGFGIIAGILGIVAAVGLIIFMLLVVVVHVTF